MALLETPACIEQPTRWGGEPSLSEIFSDSIVKAVMQADGVDPSLLEAQLRRMRKTAVWSGRIEARTGLRMMPTFPPPPLKFRTVGFPQYSVLKHRILVM